LPHASVASQVLVSEYACGHEPAVVTSLRRLTVAVPQSSDAVGAVNDGVAVHWIVAFAPAPPIVGGVISCTVITCEHTAESPQMFFTFHVLV
jgi:hypothetical protein